MAPIIKRIPSSRFIAIGGGFVAICGVGGFLLDRLTDHLDGFSCGSAGLCLPDPSRREPPGLRRHSATEPAVPFRYAVRVERNPNLTGPRSYEHNSVTRPKTRVPIGMHPATNTPHQQPASDGRGRDEKTVLLVRSRGRWPTHLSGISSLVVVCFGFLGLLLWRSYPGFGGLPPRHRPPPPPPPPPFPLPAPASAPFRWSDVSFPPPPPRGG